MERSSTPAELDDLLRRVVASSHSTGRAFVVLAVGLAQESDDEAEMRAATESALAVAEQERGVDLAAARVTQRSHGEAVGLICAEVEPAFDAADLGTTVAVELRASHPIRVGVATSAGHPNLSLEQTIAVALEGLDVARASGSTRAVHSELYELITGAASIETVVESPAESGAPVRANATPAAAPASESDDPFARMAPGAAAAPDAMEDADRSHDTMTPARERASRVAEIASLREEATALRDQDRHAHALLERRISKLAKELETAESEIGRLRATYEGDRGLSSMFRSVQGLDEAEPLAEVKKRLIDGVFRENEPE